MHAWIMTMMTCFPLFRHQVAPNLLTSCRLVWFDTHTQHKHEKRLFELELDAKRIFGFSKSFDTLTAVALKSPRFVKHAKYYI
jgi:hypothetical protein